MHLQIFLLGSLLACVCSKYVPNQSQLASYLRRRRDALSNKALHTHDELDRHYKNTLFNLEDDNLDGYNGDSYVYVPEERESLPASKKTVVSKYDQTAEASSQSASSQQPNKVNSNANYNYASVNTAKPDVSRRVYEKSEQSGKQKNKKASAQIDGEKVIAKRYSQGQALFDEQEEHYPPPKYDFKYTVHDVEHHDIKHHQEERDGENTVGEYSVLQPDGTILTVKYTVHGDEGFNAIVSKSELPHEFDHHYEH